MPRRITPKRGWHAAAILPAVTLAAAQIDALCEAAGLDPRDRRARQRVRAGVEQAIGTYQATRERDRTAPRPAHQRAAVRRVEAAADELIGAFNDLDDLSRETLQGTQRGFSVAHALTTARSWSGTATLALRALRGESRGRVVDHALNLLLALLDHAYRAAADDGDRGEWLRVGCATAGVKLTEKRLQTFLDQHDTETGR